MRQDELRSDPVVADGKQKIIYTAGTTEVTILTKSFPLLKLYFPPNWTTCNVAISESDDGVDWYPTSIETGVGASALVSTNVLANECRSYGYFLIGAQHVKLSFSAAQANAGMIKAVLAPLYGRL